jgi:hypothetical protein
MISKLLLKTALFCVLSVPALARAHYVWIESETAAEARVYFGEINEGVREKSGGRLDERAALQLWLERPGQPKEPLSVSKRADHFATSLTDASGWLLASDLTSEVKDYRKHDLGIVKPMFYARAAVANRPSAARPVLALDLIPAPGRPGTVQVFFQGKPLAGAKVFVYAPNLWMQELKSDEQGRLTPATPWPGRYVLDVTHKQADPGEFHGQRYEAVRHRMTFSFVH